MATQAQDPQACRLTRTYVEREHPIPWVAADADWQASSRPGLPCQKVDLAGCRLLEGVDGGAHRLVVNQRGAGLV
eukprot:2057058-Rhodomonas_salina.6